MIIYKKLWKILIDKDMKKSDLIEKVGLSSSTVAKLAKGENINTDVLNRICEYFNCDISEICEFVK